MSLINFPYCAFQYDLVKKFLSLCKERGYGCTVLLRRIEHLFEDLSLYETKINFYIVYVFDEKITLSEKYDI